MVDKRNWKMRIIDNQARKSRRAAGLACPCTKEILLPFFQRSTKDVSEGISQIQGDYEGKF